MSAWNQPFELACFNNLLLALTVMATTSSDEPAFSAAIAGDPGGSLASTSLSSTSTQAIGTGRPFRSRKQRPCDSCRKKKSRCAILQQGSPCVECQQTGRTCTFIEQPLERKARAQVTSPAQQGVRPDLPIDTAGASDVAHVQAPPAKRKRIQGPGDPVVNNHDDGLISIERGKDELSEPCAITALLTDDLLPVRSAGESDTGQSSGHIQVSSDSSKPVFFILRPKPSCAWSV